MAADDFTYRPQDVHYLGFLEAQLRDLQGVDTLAYELIQNADDVVDANGRSAITTLSFDVADDALIVSNDGVFRPVDFERLQQVAGGGKREEAETTGAFGIGFTAVYQVTDAPEIFSSGRHWVIRPDAPAGRRIQERQAVTDGTRFRLPWAFDPASVVRRTLRLPVIQPAQLDDLAHSLSAALETAALFLRRLELLAVRRNGRVVRQIVRRRDGAQLILEDEAGQTRRWLLLDGSFAAAAARLREAHPYQIEAVRRSDVRLALPLAGAAGSGRLYAVLPTAQTMPLPLCVNADFFPTTDRKRLHFDEGYQAAWNRAALACAAGVLARHVAELPALLGAAALWRLLQKMADTAQLAAQGDLPADFGAFWQAAAPALAEQPVFYTLQETWRRPGDGRLAPRGADPALLAALRLPAAHPDLAPYVALLRRPEIGVPELAVADVAAAMASLGLQRRRPLPLYEAPPEWRALHTWQALWALLDRLLSYQPPAARAAALAALSGCSLVLTTEMALAPLSDVFRGTPEAQALFPDAAWLHDAVPVDAFPGRDLPRFGVRQAVTRLAETPVDLLEEAWRLGRLDLPRLFRWIEQQQIEIFADDPALQRAIRRLPLCPVAGELRPLADLAIPGGFDDPLGLVGVVDLDAVGGRRQFLLDLGVQPLDFDTYVRSYLPRVLTPDTAVASDAVQRLVQLLAERLGVLQEDGELQELLSRLPLVACLDGAFRPAPQVYASREVLALLGEGAPVAEPPPNRAVAALQRWLGVRSEPGGEELLQALLALRQAQPAQRARAIWQRLGELLAAGDLAPDGLAALRGRPVVPDDTGMMRPPEAVCLLDDAALAAQFAALPAAAGRLLPADVPGAAALRAAGVRPLSQAVQRRVLAAADRAADRAADKRMGAADKRMGAADERMIEAGGGVVALLAERLVARRALLRRVLAAEGVADAALLTRLRVRRADGLQVQQVLALEGAELALPPQRVEAAMDAAGMLLVAAEASWGAVARELARVLRPETAVGGLALALREVLAAETDRDAAALLDELGM